MSGTASQLETGAAGSLSGTGGSSTVSTSGAGGSVRPRHIAVYTAAVLAGICILLLGVVWSVSIGATPIGADVIVNAVFRYDSGSISEIIIRTIRLPRAVLGTLVGADLAVAGVVMQSITENPLGAPEILGINAGAATVVVAVIVLDLNVHGLTSVPLAFAGAAVTALIVVMLAGAGQGRMNPVRLALAGVTITSLLLSLTQGMVILHEHSAQSIFFWLVGGINLATWSDVTTLLPWLIIGLIAALWLAPALNILALGEEVARGLGVNVQRTRLIGGAVVVILAGAAVAVAGPIAFIGLIIPHISRRFSGVNHFLLIPLAAILGSILLVYADIGSRFINWPFETPAGIVTSLIGAPFFIYLARKQRITA